jgi:hypothetical protein
LAGGKATRVVVVGAPHFEQVWTCYKDEQPLDLRTYLHSNGERKEGESEGTAKQRPAKHLLTIAAAIGMKEIFEFPNEFTGKNRLPLN